MGIHCVVFHADRALNLFCRVRRVKGLLKVMAPLKVGQESGKGDMFGRPAQISGRAHNQD